MSSSPVYSFHEADEKFENNITLDITALYQEKLPQRQIENCTAVSSPPSDGANDASSPYDNVSMAVYFEM